MAVYPMTATELILTFGSSKGSQIKFLKNGYWYKIDEKGPEGRAEELASKILQCSSLASNEYVTYESCDFEYHGKICHGCKSRSFLAPGEQLFSYERIYFLTTGKSLEETISLLDSPEEKIDYVVNVIRDFCGLDVREYISKVLTASMVLLDTDKHLHNFALIASADLDHFRNAPIFDNGASFLSNYDIYPLQLTIEEIKNQEIPIVGKPFAADLNYQAYVAGYGVQFDFPKIQELLAKEPPSRMRDIAEYNISQQREKAAICLSEQT